MKEVMLSIIVPVYNGEKFLERCLNSIVINLSDKIRVIVIDDGSTDASGVIADQYAAKYNNIYVIHQENAGLVASRSRGIAESRGKYISFIDADDWIDADYFDLYIDEMEADPTIDIAITGMLRNDALGNTFGKADAYEEMVGSRQAIRNMCKKRRYHWYLWGKVYRRELFENLIVDEAVNIFEDLDRNWQIFSKANKVFYSGAKCYHYFQNTAGMTEQRCKINDNSWRVFKRIIGSGIEDLEVRQCMVNFYYQVYLRLLVELYFKHNDSSYAEISAHVKELGQTMKGIDIIPDCVDREIYNQTTETAELCMVFLRKLFSSMEATVLAAQESAKQLFVYGTGVVSLYVAEYIRRHNVKVAAYVVSDGQLRKQEFCGRPVYYLSDVSEKEDSVFLLALSSNMHPIIRELLGAKRQGDVYAVDFPPILF